LQASGQVRSLSDDHLLLRRLLADGVTDDDHAGCNSNPHLQRLPGRKQELTDLRHEIEPNPHGAFSIVLVRLGVAKVDKESVAHEAGHMPAHPSDHRGATTLESADHVAQVFGIERSRQSRRADEIAKKDGQLASLGLGLRQSGDRGRRGGGRCRAWQRSLANFGRRSESFPLVLPS
jgi:hypothetical protein